MTLEQHVTALPTMSLAQKKAEWRRLTCKPVPLAFGAGLLTRAIAYTLQKKELGGLSRKTAGRIDELARQSHRQSGSKAPASLKPGTWLSRTWHGEAHQLIVLESGFEYNGERYASLSAIARKITGAGWSGPRFFGINSPRLGKPGTSPDG